MLDTVVGPGNAVVSVTADLDYDQTARTTETFTAGVDLPPLSSATSLEEYTGDQAAVGGVLGPDGLEVPVTEAGGGGDYRKETATVNNPLNRVTEEMTTTPGSVRRQSVSVVVSQEAAADLDLVELQTAVAAAAGIDATRGDVVSVSRMTFDTSSAETAQAALALADEDVKAEEAAGLIRQGVIAGAILLALILAFVTAKRRGRKARREAIDLGALQLLESRSAEAISPAVERLALPAAAAARAVDDVTAKREDLVALAADQPAEVADLLRGWLVGGRR